MFRTAGSHEKVPYNLIAERKSIRTRVSKHRKPMLYTLHNGLSDLYSKFTFVLIEEYFFSSQLMKRKRCEDSDDEEVRIKTSPGHYGGYYNY